MGFIKSISKAVDKVSNAVGFTNTTTGIAKLIQDETGMSPSQQYATGGTAGFLNMLGGAMSGDENNNGILSALFGSNSESEGVLGSLLGSVVKGAVGIGSNYFENQQYLKDQQKLNDQTFQHNRALADEAYQRDVAMWNMQNAYNAPSQQMERLKQAGLNPNLVYGSGNVTGNTAGSPPSYPQVQYPSAKAEKLNLMRNVLGIFDQYQSIKNQALDNQREAAKIGLQARSLKLAEDREKNREAAEERRFQLLLAQLGFQREKENNRVNEVEQNREDKKNAPTTTQKEFNWIADTIGEGLQYPIYYGLRYLDWLTEDSRNRSR